MALSQWYELRVAGSAGTSSEIARGISEGIAMGNNGRLCAIGSEQTIRFATEQEACDYLSQTTILRFYDFEAVLCRPDEGNGRPAPCAAVHSASLIDKRQMASRRTCPDRRVNHAIRIT
jgi:hypothetical protein